MIQKWSFADARAPLGSGECWEQCMSAMKGTFLSIQVSPREMRSDDAGTYSSIAFLSHKGCMNRVSWLLLATCAWFTQPFGETSTSEYIIFSSSRAQTRNPIIPPLFGKPKQNKFRNITISHQRFLSPSGTAILAPVLKTANYRR